MRDIRLVLVAVFALAAVLLSIWQLEASKSGLVIQHTQEGTTPLTVYRPDDTTGGPIVVIAHGFAGSQQLMEPLALSIAQSGYTALTFDFLGHGHHSDPLSGDITREEGATQALLAQLQDMVTYARSDSERSDEIALLAHSMGSDIVVRAAKEDSAIAGIVTISMFSREVTSDQPRNLLMIVGDWEGGLKQEALRILKLRSADGVVEGETYGAFEDGSARRAVFADSVEHVGVLYSGETQQEVIDWLNAIFERQNKPEIILWGPWIGLLFFGAVILYWPVSSLLPRVSATSPTNTISRRRFLLAALIPAVLTPLVLWFVPTSFLPVLVGDYLALHFALYGIITAIVAICFRPKSAAAKPLNWANFVAAVVLATGYVIAAIILPIDAYVTALIPNESRAALSAIMLVGTLSYFCADEWFTRGVAQGWGRVALTKLFFLASLAIAIALNISDLFFLIIIFPVIIAFFIIFGLFNALSYRSTGSVLVGALASASAFAIAIAGSFPIIEGS